MHFSYSTRWGTMMELAETTLGKGKFAKIRVTVDHNGTRVSARRTVLFDSIRIAKPF